MYGDRRGNSTTFILILLILAGSADLGSAQALKPGDPAPPITATPVAEAKPFPGWPGLRGNVVVIDFWGTWCAPCLPALNTMAQLEKRLAGEPIRFFTVAADDVGRVKTYVTEKAIGLQTFVDTIDGKTIQSWGIHVFPTTAIIDRDGKIIALTDGSRITESVLRSAIAGQKLDLPPVAQRTSNLDWDKDEIQWQDGIPPSFAVIIKPTEPTGGVLSAYRPGATRLSGDGIGLDSMIQAAWQTDMTHLDPRMKWPSQAYRFVAVVPPGRQTELLPALQDAIERNFGIAVHWQTQTREVLVLKRTNEAAPLANSNAAESLMTFAHGTITMKKQTTAALAKVLPNWTRRIVVDESGLSGSYDFVLEYRADGPSVLADSLREKYGLELTPATRAVEMLVVENK